MFFVQNLVMRRIPELKACFLSESTENAPKPQDLKNALDKVTFLSSFASNDRYSSFTLKFTISLCFLMQFCFLEIIFTGKCHFYRMIVCVQNAIFFESLSRSSKNKNNAFYDTMSQFWLLVVLAENESVVILTSLSPKVLSKIMLMEWVPIEIEIWWEATHFFLNCFFSKALQVPHNLLILLKTTTKLLAL